MSCKINQRLLTNYILEKLLEQQPEVMQLENVK